MRRALLVGALVLIPLSAVVIGGPDASAQPSGPTWWNEDWPFRVIVSASSTTQVADVGSGPSDMVGYELNFEHVLEKAGWPRSLSWAPEPTAITVVPYDTIGAGTAAGDPIPARVSDPVSRTGTCDPSATARCLVAWEKVPGAQGYGIYWTPDGWGPESPVDGPRPQLTGTMKAHEHVFRTSGFADDMELLIHPVPEQALITQKTAQGSTTVYDTSTPGSGSCEIENDVLACSISSGFVQLLAGEPVHALAHERETKPPLTIPLSGTTGQVDTDLGAVIPSSWSRDLELVVWSHEGSCPCEVAYEPSPENADPPSPFQLTSSSARTIELPSSTAPRHVEVSVESGGPVHAAIRGDGFAPIEARNAEGTNAWLPLSGSGQSSVAMQPSRPMKVNLNDISHSERLQEGRQVEPPLETIPVGSETRTLEIDGDEPFQAFTGAVRNLGLPAHQPLPENDELLVPDGARLVAVGTALGEGTQTAEFTAIDGREPSTTLVRLGSGQARTVLPTGEGASIVGVDANATLGLLAVAPGPKTPGIANGLGVHHPADADLESAAYTGEAIDLSVTPSSQFAGSGSVVEFNVTVTNEARGADGSTPSLTVDLGLEPIGLAAEKDLEPVLSTDSLQLPAQRGASKTAQLSVRVPDGVSDVVLETLVSATVRGEERLSAEDSAQVSVVTIRDFELAFADESSQQTQTAEANETNEFDLRVRNTGTVEATVELDHDTFGSSGFDTCLTTPDTQACREQISIKNLEPGETAPATLRVQAPDQEEEARLEATVRGELAEGGGPVRTVDATVFLQVPVAATIQLSEDRVVLPPGGSQTLTVKVVNQGVQAQGTLTVPGDDEVANATLIDPETGQPNATLTHLLGPRDTQRATWETELQVSVSENATPGLNKEHRIELDLDPSGDLPGERFRTNLPVRVIRVLGDEPVSAPSIPPGTTSELEVPIQIESLRDSTVGLRLFDAPTGWDVTTPANLTFDANGRTVLSFNVTPPPGAEAGAERVTLDVLDPLGPGGQLPVDLGVTRGGHAQLDVPASVEIPLGGSVPFPVEVRNVGNEELSGELAIEPEDTLSLSSPSIPELAPANGTMVVSAQLTAKQTHDGPAELQVLDEGRLAGNETIQVRSARAELSFGPGLVVPDGTPTAGEMFPVTFTVRNHGSVSVRNLTVGLLEADELAATTTIERLPARSNATATLEWLPDHEPDPQQLSLRIDPEGQIEQDQSDDTQTLETTKDTPWPGLVLTIVALSLPTGARGVWRLMSRTERWVAVVGVVVLLALVPLLFVPAVTVDPSPAQSPAPESVTDSDDDGLSDAAEVTRYGTDIENPDSDEDELPDGWEAEHGRWNATLSRWEPDPARADAREDPDDDGLSNLAEHRNETDPLARDTDEDGFDDGWEVRSLLDPTEPTDPEADCSGNGLTNAEEYEIGTLACRTDSDRDGIPDVAERDGEWTIDGEDVVFEPTDPTAFSTAGSGAPDGWLIAHELDPHDDKHSTADPDGDKLSTAREWEVMENRGFTEPGNWTDGMAPSNPDSDGDGLPDGWETRNRLDPLDPADGGVDPDGDGLTNGEEFQAGTSPYRTDSDGDGLSDGREVGGWTITVNGDEAEVRSNPLIRDTDGDGLSDREESEGRTAEGRTFSPTNPLSGDTDGDGQTDGFEVTALEAPDQLDPTNDDTDGDGLLDGEEWTFWESKVQRAETDPEYVSLLRSEVEGSPDDMATILAPDGDLDGDGQPNVLDPNSDGHDHLPERQRDGLQDGEEVHPPLRGGRTLPASDASLADTDGDDLPDEWEVQHTRFDAERGIWLLDPKKEDSDGDGVPDTEEDMETGCFGPGSKGDGPSWWDVEFSNENELQKGTDPLDCDTDGDGLPDGWEDEAARRAQGAGVSLRLDPINPDSDSDDVPDGDEVSPLPVPSNDALLWSEEHPACTEDRQPTGKGLCLPRWQDSIPKPSRVEDGPIEFVKGSCNANLEEVCVARVVLNLTNELEAQTDPSRADTDGDGFTDAWEVLHRFPTTDAQFPQSTEDPDNDNLETQQEYTDGTHPRVADTDAGSLRDGVDIDPLDPTDDTGDCDWDDIPDRDEATGDTQAGNPDTDGDGLLDSQYNPEGCDAGGEVRKPNPGTDLVAVPDGQGGFQGEDDFATNPTDWASRNDKLPDGWKALHVPEKTGTQVGGTDADEDGLSIHEEYELGKPAWWDEIEHGAWWFGSDPNEPTAARDLDGDGLDDGLFDPEPLSPDNDCQLPDGWQLPPAWTKARCLSEKPTTNASLDALLTGLRQLAYEHVLTVDDPQSQRADSRAGNSVAVHTEPDTLAVTTDQPEDVVRTDRPFNLTVDLCARQADGCASDASTQPPLVGIYASTSGDPNPKEDALLCVVDPGADGDAWTASTADDGLAQKTAGEDAPACHLGPGERQLDSQADGLILAPHRHGSLEAGGTWTVEPGDLEPGRPVTLAAWPLPTDRGDTLLVAGQADGPDTPATQSVTPEAQAALNLEEDPILEAGKAGEATLILTDTVGHPLPHRKVSVTWNDGPVSNESSSASGRVSVSLRAVETDQPLSLPLNASFEGGTVVEGASRTFEIPVRVGARLTANLTEGTAPGTLPVEAVLEDENGRPLDDRTLTAKASLPGDAGTVEATGVTDENGFAEIVLPLPPDTQPGQTTVEVAFPGDDEAAGARTDGLADVRVRPAITLEAPSEAQLTEGLFVEAGLTLRNQNHTPLRPAPGEPLELVFELDGVTDRQTFTTAPSEGTVRKVFAPGPQVPLGSSNITVRLEEGRFTEAVENRTSTTVRTAVTTNVTPSVFGAGVDNDVTLTVRDALGRTVSGVPIQLQVFEETAQGTTGPQGQAEVNLSLPVDAPRGPTTAEVTTEGTDRTLPRSEEIDATVHLGTRFQVPDNTTGSLDELSLEGTLETATGEPVTEALVRVEGLGSLDLVTDEEGSFLATLQPPPDTSPGTHTLRVSYEGTDELAPARAEVDAQLLRSVNLTVEDPGLVPLGAQARLAGTLDSGGEPITDGFVEIKIQDETARAPLSDDGSFSGSVPVPEGDVGQAIATVTFPRQNGFAERSKTVELAIVETVDLTTTKRSEEGGVTITAQATTQDGQPLANEPVLALLPSGTVRLETDENGVARYRLAENAVTEDTEIEFRYPGDESRAPASTTVQIQSTGAALPGTSTTAIAIGVAVLLIEAVVLWRVYRRRQAVQTVVEAVQGLESRLRAGDELRAAVVQTFKRIQQGLEALGLEDESWETHREYLERSFDALDADTEALGPFMDLLDRAQYGAEPMRPEDRVEALELSQDLLHALIEQPARGEAS